MRIISSSGHKSHLVLNFTRFVWTRVETNVDVDENVRTGSIIDTAQLIKEF